MKIVIVGAGMACASALVASGHAVTLFDKGRAPGGRMSSRRAATPAGEPAFDHGAQHFTVRDPGFAACLEAWAAEGAAARWPQAGPDAWVGVPAMNAPLRLTARALDVHWLVQVDALERDDEGWQVEGRRFDAAVIATPAEQAAPLLRPCDEALAARAASTPAAPFWTVMAAFAEKLPIAADILREQGIIGWPLPTPLTATAHRWRYARSGAAGDGCLWNPNLRLGACGDWMIGPRVEAAWRSGRRLAAAASA